jgi:Antibiotic biosynthesis monooxygenase
LTPANDSFAHGGPKKKRLRALGGCRVGAAVAAALHIQAHGNDAGRCFATGRSTCDLTVLLPRRRITVPVLIRHRSAMSAAQYDQSAPPLVEQLRKQPGFLLHVTYEDADGFVVAEVWETQQHHDTWFDANVKLNIPFEITQEVVDLHTVHTP